VDIFILGKGAILDYQTLIHKDDFAMRRVFGCHAGPDPASTLALGHGSRVKPGMTAKTTGLEAMSLPLLGISMIIMGFPENES
jgi:hypothetical protein